MKCNQCGTQFEGKFFPNCGASAVEQAPVMPVASVKAKNRFIKNGGFG